MGVVAGMAAGAVCVSAAQAQESDGPSLELTASAAEIDLASATYGYNFTAQAPVIDHDESDTGARLDARLSGLNWSIFGANGRAYVRASYQDAGGSISSSYAKAPGDTIVVPTGFVGFDEFESLATTGSGNIVARRTVDQSEADIGVGFEFDGEMHGFSPRIEIAFRRSEIEHVMTADRLGVTPVLEEFSTDNGAIESNCADLGVGFQITTFLSSDWSFVADLSTTAGFCSHDMDRSFEYDSLGNSYESQSVDENDNVSLRGALQGRFVRRLNDRAALNVTGFVRGESAAPYIAYPVLTFDNNNLPVVTGTVRIETEARASYGLGLSLTFALD